MKKTGVIVIILIFILLSTQFTIADNISTNYDDPKSSETITEARGDGSRMELWFDTFSDFFKINSSDSIVIRDGAVKFPIIEIPNNGFEMGSVGKLPSDWEVSEFNRGSGSHYHNASIVDEDYYEGSQAFTGFSKVVSEGNITSRQAGTYLNMSSYIDASGISTITIYMRDLYHYHSTHWGWNDGITIVYMDGVNTYDKKGKDGEISNLYWSGENIGTDNYYDYTMIGEDGNRWYIYRKTIPSGIDKSHMKIGICWWATSWSDGSHYDEISSIIDNIVFDMPQSGYIISEPIEIPSLSYGHLLEIDKITPPGTSILTTVLDGSNNISIPGYIDLNQSIIDLSDIDPLKYPKIKLKAQLMSINSETPVLNEWSLSFIPNGVPQVEDYSVSNTQVYRTKSVSLRINCTDKEQAESELNVSFLYKSPTDTIWHSDYFSNLRYDKDHWTIDFIPPKTAIPGQYSFLVNCADTFGSIGTLKIQSAIKVLNNIPKVHKIDLSSYLAQIRDTIIITMNGSDIEDDLSKLTCAVQVQPPIGDWSELKTSLTNDTFETTFSPEEFGQIGDYNFRVRLRDSTQAYSSWLYLNDSLEVFNDAPFIDGDDVIMVYSGSRYSSVYYGIDDNNDTLSWKMGTNASWLESVTTTSNITLFGVPEDDDVGQYWVSIQLSDPLGGLASKNLTINVLFNDEDKDGLSYTEETNLGTDPLNFDTDGDGIGDGLELNFGTSPLDKDNDGIVDLLDEYPDDEDNDGIPDSIDPYDNRYEVKINIYEYFLTSDNDLRFFWSLEGEEGIKQFTHYKVILAENEKALEKAIKNGRKEEYAKIIFIRDQNSRNHTIRNLDPKNDYYLQMTVVMDTEQVVSNQVNITTRSINKLPYDSTFISINIVLIILVIGSLIFIGGARHSEVFLLSMVMPLSRFTSKKNKDNSETRLKILGLIEGVPGIHYRRIKETFNLGNGACAYHLHRLEKEGRIISKKEGVYKRFYPVIQERKGRSIKTLPKLRQEIVKLLQQEPGASLMEISYLLDKDKRQINYHLTKMVKNKTVQKMKLTNGHTQYFLRVKFISGKQDKDVEDDSEENAPVTT